MNYIVRKKKCVPQPPQRYNNAVDELSPFLTLCFLARIFILFLILGRIHKCTTSTVTYYTILNKLFALYRYDHMHAFNNTTILLRDQNVFAASPRRQSRKTGMIQLLKSHKAKSLFTSLRAKIIMATF